MFLRNSPPYFSSKTYFPIVFSQFILFQVSWLRRRPGQDVPLLLTFGETVYVSDVRFSIRRSNEDWILDILHAKTEDEAIYECQVSTEPPKIHKIFLAVEGKNFFVFQDRKLNISASV